MRILHWSRKQHPFSEAFFHPIPPSNHPLIKDGRMLWEIFLTNTLSSSLRLTGTNDIASASEPASTSLNRSESSFLRSRVSARKSEKWFRGAREKRVPKEDKQEKKRTATEKKFSWRKIFEPARIASSTPWIRNSRVANPPRRDYVWVVVNCALFRRTTTTTTTVRVLRFWSWKVREEIRRGGKISGSGRRLGVNPVVPESGGQVVPENGASGEVSAPFG